MSGTQHAAAVVVGCSDSPGQIRRKMELGAKIAKIRKNSPAKKLKGNRAILELLHNMNAA
jgi:hypothetical protein